MMKKKFLRIICFTMAFAISIAISFVGLSSLMADSRKNNQQNTTPMVSYSGAGTESNPYLLSSASDLRSLESFHNNVRASFNTTYYKLTANIDFGNNELKPIENFDYAVLDGNNFYISNIKISNIITNYGSGSYLGIFATIFHTTIKNINFSNIKVNNSDSFINYCACIVANAYYSDIFNILLESGELNIKVNGYAGGIVGYANFTKLTYCLNYANINISNLSGSLQNKHYIGGIVGYALTEKYPNTGMCIFPRGEILYCANFGNIVVQNCDASKYTGGIAGFTKLYQGLKDCFNRGNITVYGDSIYSCGATAGIVAAGGCSNVYNTGTIIGSRVNSDNSTGAVDVNYGAGKFFVNVYYKETHLNMSELSGYSSVSNGYSTVSINYGFTYYIRIKAENTFVVNDWDISNSECNFNFQKTDGKNPDGGYAKISKLTIDGENYKFTIKLYSRKKEVLSKQVVRATYTPQGTIKDIKNIVPSGFSKDIWFCSPGINDGYPTFRYRYWEGI